MALVVLLRGVNVGGHKVFRPKLFAEQLRQLRAVNIGAAGTFVIWEPISKSRLRSELTSRLPFKTEIVICQGREILDLISEDPFIGQPLRPGIVRFVSVLSIRSCSEPLMPISFPSENRWLVRILGRKDRFIFGVYRRHMQTIRYLGMVDRLFDGPLTTRNWNTIHAIAKVVQRGEI